MNNNKLFYNAHHSPIGAFASFTLGFRGAKGGLGLELPGPANQNVFIGIEKDDKSGYKALPFYDATADARTRYDIEKESVPAEGLNNIELFDDNEINRELYVSTDIWTAEDFTFKIISPVRSVPDPTYADENELKLTVAPAVIVEITVDNRRGCKLRRAFFGYEGNDPYSAMRRVNDEKLKGIGHGQIALIASKDKAVRSGLGFHVKEILTPDKEQNLSFGLGPVGALVMEVQANEIKTFTFAVSFYRQGIATADLDTAYYYTKFFNNVNEVADFVLDNIEIYKQWAADADLKIENSKLSDIQKFLMAYSIRSYYGSTQLLKLKDGSPFWIVNEGEYRMMNTFDLTVDQLFFEMEMNPWTVRNELDMFADRYCYYDKVRFPGDDTEYPGGISFTHDMGVANVISRPGFSSYELFGVSGCLSHMTHEQLVNWVLCASVYFEQTQDKAWLDKRQNIVANCLESMLNRDNPDPAKRNGIMALDSSRCMGGAEITTYDSLDESLGQARNNIYMAVKCWAAYLALEKMLGLLEDTNFAKMAGMQAMRCADTLVGHATDEGYIPAIINENNDAKIISVVEGLVFPYLNGCQTALDEAGKFGFFIKALKTHIETVLVPGICLFNNGGWKLSSTRDNTWLSKIFLCQFIVRKILSKDIGEDSDKVHISWVLDENNSYFSCCDQIVSGIAKGSKYNPRAVTSILWLRE